MSVIRTSDPNSSQLIKFGATSWATPSSEQHLFRRSPNRSYADRSFASNTFCARVKESNVLALHSILGISECLHDQANKHDQANETDESD
ncbi:MAG: hypothetical protein JNL64_10140 [Blastocatellia bacterium]|nr:hypothetical protein [Blastocatellia bacterium]